MKTFLKKSEVYKYTQNEKKLGFVPTMGTIHSGHISLIKRSIKECNKTIVTIFINKPQFNKKSDYLSYPKSIKKDIKILKSHKIDFLYIPSHKEIYPHGPSKKIKINTFAKKLCGKNRPGHFEAVVDVICRFIKIIKPAKIYLGKKDMQQLKIVEDYINRNFKDIKVVGCKTIRENNGLAISSRNLLLSKKEKEIGSLVYKLILKNKKKIIMKKNYLKSLHKKIKNLGIYNIDYLKLINTNKIIKPFKIKKEYRIFISYYLGRTRLIDNV